MSITSSPGHTSPSMDFIIAGMAKQYWTVHLFGSSVNRKPYTEDSLNVDADQLAIVDAARTMSSAAGDCMAHRNRPSTPRHSPPSLDFSSIEPFPDSSPLIHETTAAPAPVTHVWLPLPQNSFPISPANLTDFPPLPNTSILTWNLNYSTYFLDQSLELIPNRTV